MIHILLPLDLFRVSYDVAVGRPYSRLEQLLLRLICDDQGDEGRTFQELRKAFQVHDRLLIEALVTLLREGWVAMVQNDQEIRYVATAEGLLTTSSGRRPSSLRVQRRQENIVRELMEGQLARQSDLDLVTARDVRRKTNRGARSFALTERQHRKTLNGGETEWLLPRNAEEQQWIRRIDSNARMVSGRYYLPLRVDLDKATVLGLPVNWSHLTSLILEETEQEYQNQSLASGSAAQERFDKMIKEWQRERDRVRRSSVQAAELVTVPCVETALLAGDSRRLAERALADATTHALIVISQLDDHQVARVIEVAADLRSRGVGVDVLWSCANDEALRKRLVNALGATRAKGLKGKVLFNRTPTDALADFVLAATDKGPVAVMGTGLLSVAAQDKALSPAVLVRDVRGLSNLALLASGWWQGSPDDNAELAASRWRHLSERWVEEAALSGAAPCTEEAEASWNVPTPDVPSPQPVNENSVTATLLVGAEGPAARKRLIGSSAAALVSRRLRKPWDSVSLVGTAEEWVVGLDTPSVSALALLLRGRVAAELWTQARADSDPTRAASDWVPIPNEDVKRRA
ncbi:hypothetical protein [Streptomyces aidingensis]|uniref:Uncharacterized protein n=1 Tax=Streptomyces aidingensis TaxID=910347 RepID=A0A1I1SCY3_9ACTN|nr:hypothetical protein [Streptomyces aidingensis]SFD42468.1 hypothetical protein SAMN05421773_11511 [Streptomyces aidingensis]